MVSGKEVNDCVAVEKERLAWSMTVDNMCYDIKIKHREIVYKAVKDISVGETLGCMVVVFNTVIPRLSRELCSRLPRNK